MNKEICEVGTTQTLRELREEAKKRRHDMNNELQRLYIFIEGLDLLGMPVRAERLKQVAQNIQEINNRDNPDVKLEREFDEMLDGPL